MKETSKTWYRTLEERLREHCSIQLHAKNQKCSVQWLFIKLNNHFWFILGHFQPKYGTELFPKKRFNSILIFMLLFLYAKIRKTTFLLDLFIAPFSPKTLKRIFFWKFKDFMLLPGKILEKFNQYIEFSLSILTRKLQSTIFFSKTPAPPLFRFDGTLTSCKNL